MSTPPIKRVQAGQPISAHEWNRIRTALGMLQSREVVGSSGTRLPNTTDCTHYAVNVSGALAPAGSPCSILGRNVADSGFLVFDESGDEPYGIVLDPISNGAVGLVALSGGPYRLRLASGTTVAVGDRLQPKDGTFTAELGGEVWRAITDNDSDSYCWAVFYSPPTFRIDVRDNDPATADVGYIWIRSDL